MKKTILSLVLAVCLLSCLGLTAYAAELGGTVVFDGKELTSSYNAASVTDKIGALEPGDDISFEFTLTNNYDGETSWWMKNSVVDSFETLSKARGGT